MQKCARTCDEAANLPILFDVKPNNLWPVEEPRCATNHALVFPCSVPSKQAVLADQGSSRTEVVRQVRTSLPTANGAAAEIIHAKPGVAGSGAPFLSIAAATDMPRQTSPAPKRAISLASVASREAAVIP